MKEINVVAAILIVNNKVLAFQRKEGKHAYISKKYEFPGGKINEFETSEQALTRELFEELDITYEVKKEEFFLNSSFQYPDFKLNITTFLIKKDTINYRLKEHLSCAFLNFDDLFCVEWADADIEILKELIKYQNKGQRIWKLGY